MIVDLDQERASLVLKWLDRLEDTVDRSGSAPFWKSYAQTAKALPVPIRAMGIAAAVGLSLQAARRDFQRDPAPALMLATLADRLRSRAQELDMDGIASEASDLREPLPGIERLLSELIDLRRADYRVLQSEALAFIAWVKILASAKVPLEEADPSDIGDLTDGVGA